MVSYSQNCRLTSVRFSSNYFTVSANKPAAKYPDQTYFQLLKQ